MLPPDPSPPPSDRKVPNSVRNFYSWLTSTTELTYSTIRRSFGLDEDEGDDEGELEVSLGEVKDSVDFKVAVLVVDELTSMVAKGTGGVKMAFRQ